MSANPTQHQQATQVDRHISKCYTPQELFIDIALFVALSARLSLNLRGSVTAETVTIHRVRKFPAAVAMATNVTCLLEGEKLNVCIDLLNRVLC
jgi:hypothetical protein